MLVSVVGSTMFFVSYGGQSAAAEITRSLTDLQCLEKVPFKLF